MSQQQASYTVGSLIEAISEQFTRAGLVYGHGTDNPWDEAVALVLDQTGAADDASELATPVPLGLVTDIVDLAERRVQQRVPLAYLLKRCHYMGLEFHIRPGVIVPRSPLGYLLQEGLEAWLPECVERVVDLCCGSGCLGITAALTFPDSHVELVDIDPLACEVAAENVALHGLSARVSVTQIDVTSADAKLAPADVLLCNPPYVNALDMGTLPREYRAEPELGLAAGEQGLDVILPVLARLPDWLTPQGLFIGEVGASAPALLAAQPDLPWVWPDLARGGEGVFVLEAGAVSSHTARLRN